MRVISHPELIHPPLSQRGRAVEENTRKAIVREHLAMSLNGLTGAISPSRRRKVSNPARLVLRVQSYLSGHRCQQHFLPRSLTRAVWEMNSISTTIGKLLPQNEQCFLQEAEIGVLHEYSSIRHSQAGLAMPDIPCRCYCTYGEGHKTSFIFVRWHFS